MNTEQNLINTFAEYLNFYAFSDIEAVNTIVNKKLYLHNAVTENTKIIDQNITILRRLLY